MPGDLVILEDLLPDWWSEWVAEYCRALSVPTHRWERIPDIQRVATQLAVQELADRIRDEEGLSATAAWEEAASRLRISPRTVLSRRERALQRAFPSS